MNVPELQIVGEQSGVFRLGAWNDVGVFAWWSQPTLPAANKLHELLGTLRAQRDIRRTFIHLIPDRLGLPDAASRSRMVQTMKEYEHQTACICMIVGGTGFWASAMRNAIIGLRVLAPRSFDYRIFADAAPLVAWLPEAHEQRTQHALQARDVLALIEQAQRWQAEPQAGTDLR